MRIQIPAFLKLRKEYNSLILNNSEILDCNNVVFDRAKVLKRWGYTEFGDNLPLNGRVSLIAEYKKLRSSDDEIIVCTDKDIYKYYSGSWIFITPIYNTGTVSVSGTAVTGSGTTWDNSNWPASQYYIKFGTNDVNGTGSPDTWYLVDSFDSSTTLTLNADGGSHSGVTYVIRRVFALSVIDDWKVDYVIEPSGGDDELWAIFTNGTEIWSYIGSNQMVDLSGTTLGAKYIRSYFDHIVIANVKDGSNLLPQSVYWNNRGDPEDWSSGSYGYEDLIQGTGIITGLEILNQRLFVVKTDSIIEGYYTTEVSPAITFEQDKIYRSGCVNGKTLINTGTKLIFQGIEHITMFDGFQVSYIDDDIANELVLNMNTEYVYKNFAVHLAEKFLYCLFLVSVESTEPDKCFVYNYRSDIWTIWELSDYMRCFGSYTIQDSLAWEDIEDGVLWTDYDGIWNIRTLTAGSNAVALGDALGYVYTMDYTRSTDNGENIDCYIETKDYEALDDEALPIDKAMKLLKTMLTLESYLGDIRIACSIDFGQTWSSYITFTQSTIRHYYQRWLRRGNQLRFRITNYDNSQFTLINMIIEYVESGRIN